MRLSCASSNEHRTFLRESYDLDGHKVNTEVVDEYGRFISDLLDLYSGDFTYRFFCIDCGEEASEEG